MDVLRLGEGDVAALGGPVAAAARLRALVPAGESVAADVAEILAAVRERGDAALAELTQRLDTGGREPAPLLVEAEALDEAIRQMPLELVAGLQVAIANVAETADAGAGRESSLELPQGQQLRLREVPVGSAAVYVPGGRAPYPSTVVMGVVTARSAGVIDVAVCSPPGPDGEIDPAVLGTCRLCGVERVYRMGGAQAIAALAYGTETVRPVDVIVGPGQPLRAGGQAPALRDGRHRRLRRARPTCWSSSARRVAPTRSSWPRWTCSPRPSTARAASSRPSRRRASCATSLATRLEELVVERPSVGEAAFAIVEVAGAAEAIALANEFAAEHLQLIGEDVERLVRRRAQRGLPVRRRGQRDRIRRLRCGLQPHPSDRRRRALRVRPHPAPLPPAHDRGPHRPRRREAGRARAPRSPAPRASRSTPSRWRRASGRMARHEPHGQHRAQDRRDRRPPVAVAGRNRRGRAQHRRGLPRPHARPARAPRPHRPRRRGRRRSGDRRAPHGRGHRDRARPGARRGARRPRRDHPLRLGDRADGRGQGELRDRHLGPAVDRLRGLAAARRPPAASSTS